MVLISNGCILIVYGIRQVFKDKYKYSEGMSFKDVEGFEYGAKKEKSCPHPQETVAKILLLSYLRERDSQSRILSR